MLFNSFFLFGMLTLLHNLLYIFAEWIRHLSSNWHLKSSSFLRNLLVDLKRPWQIQCVNQISILAFDILKVQVLLRRPKKCNEIFSVAVSKCQSNLEISSNKFLWNSSKNLNFHMKKIHSHFMFLHENAIYWKMI